MVTLLHSENMKISLRTIQGVFLEVFYCSYYKIGLIYFTPPLSKIKGGGVCFRCYITPPYNNSVRGCAFIVISHPPPIKLLGGVVS